MELNRGILGRIAYGTLFVLLVPAGLVAWTHRLQVDLPALRSPLGGGLLMGIGAILIAWGMLDLWRLGGGLPMNAYPPSKLVREGIYAWLPHPIYLGFVTCVGAASLWSGSAAGLWVTTPLAALGCLSLVLGYEAPDLRKRFGEHGILRPWLGLAQGEGPASRRERWGTMTWVLGLWLLAYWAIKALGFTGSVVETRMDWEWSIPILPGSMWIYESIYLVIPAAFLLQGDRKRLRLLATGAISATVLNNLLYLALPLSAVFRSAPGGGWLAAWLSWEQHHATPAVGSFPSFHATWAVLAAWSLARSGSRSARIAWGAWCVALCASCLTTGMHSLGDVVAGASVGLLLVRPDTVWRTLLEWTESLGNSWTSWRVGGLRILSHAVWSGLAGAAGILVIGACLRQESTPWVVFVSIASLLGAALWAQWVEGSSALLRPFGYYGCILGGLAALLATWIAGGPAETLIGAFALASPFVQAIGRLRCVVQGCCHGRPVGWGIRIANPHSRVVKLAGLSGTPIHPTPLYSILGNLAMGALLLRWCFDGTSALRIAGAYLVLAGMLRFAEEAYRGEPQTGSFQGLALYQWMALASTILGMILMALPSGQVLELGFPPIAIWAGALAWGLVSAFAMSMDFPNSTRRFSRLTG